MLRLLCAAFSAAFFVITGCATATEPAPRSAATVFNALQSGGYVLVMRHANSPSDQKAPLGLSAGCTLGDGRGLDALGFYQARALGELMRDHDVPIQKAYTSPMCRSWDTAALAAAGAPVEMSRSQVSVDPAEIAAFKTKVAQELVGASGNIILASHSNIAPLYGATTRDGEDEVPSGVIYVIDPSDWRVFARIDLVNAPGQPSVAVE